VLIRRCFTLEVYALRIPIFLLLSNLDTNSQRDYETLRF